MARRGRFWFGVLVATLSMLVGVLAILLGQQVGVVLARKAFLKQHAISWSENSNLDFYPALPGPPFYRRWLGDEHVARINLCSTHTMDEAAALFPEAREIWPPLMPPNFRLTY